MVAIIAAAAAAAAAALDMLCTLCLVPLQFLTYGDVTAIGVGPGVMPWQKHAVEPEGFVLPTYHTFHDEVLPRCGDGFGRIGTHREPLCALAVGACCRGGQHHHGCAWRECGRPPR